MVLTLNEEPTIETCLNQFRPFVDYILVLDGGSTDRTVPRARAIADKVVIKPFSGSFAKEKNYAWSLVPKDCGWILWSDVDEKWDEDFLKNIKGIIVDAEIDGVACFRFPRFNFPNGKDWPDYQVRFVMNRDDFEWRGKIHEVLWWVSENVRLDEADDPKREKCLGVGNANPYIILHAERREDLERSWW